MDPGPPIGGGSAALLIRRARESLAFAQTWDLVFLIAKFDLFGLQESDFVRIADLHLRWVQAATADLGLSLWIFLGVVRLFGSGAKAGAGTAIKPFLPLDRADLLLILGGGFTLPTAISCGLHPLRLVLPRCQVIDGAADWLQDSDSFEATILLDGRLWILLLAACSVHRAVMHAPPIASLAAQLLAECAAKSESTSRIPLPLFVQVPLILSPLLAALAGGGIKAAKRLFHLMEAAAEVVRRIAFRVAMQMLLVCH